MRSLLGTIVVLATLIATNPAKAEIDGDTGAAAGIGAAVLGLGCMGVTGTGRGCLEWAAGGALGGVAVDQMRKSDRANGYYGGYVPVQYRVMDIYGQRQVFRDNSANHMIMDGGNNNPAVYNGFKATDNKRIFDNATPATAYNRGNKGQGVRN